MDELGLGYSVLSDINPGVIVTSISHFGQTGPHKDYKGCDIVDMARGGYLYLSGDKDRPPVRISAPQAYANGGAEAAAGTMIAFNHRQLTGEGQWVDVSIQQSLPRLMVGALQVWEFGHQLIRREGRSYVAVSDIVRPQTWLCKDGAIGFPFMGGATAAGTNRGVVEWMAEEGMTSDFLKGIKWEEFDMTKTTQEFVDHIVETLGKFFVTHTLLEL